MPHSSHNPLQEAIYELLSSDNILTNTVTGIFDRPPQGTGFPYITMGDMETRDWSTKTTTGSEHHIRIHIWSREGGRKESASIMERLHGLLHNASPPVTGHSIISLRFQSSNITLEKDGWTYHGAMRFRALLQANP